MSRIGILIVMAAALSLTACVQTTYSKLYPLPVKYRYGAPQPNFGTGPLPIPGPSLIPERSPARPPTTDAR